VPEPVWVSGTASVDRRRRTFVGGTGVTHGDQDLGTRLFTATLHFGQIVAVSLLWLIAVIRPAPVPRHDETNGTAP
jgi:hypothetical protein